MRKIWMSPWSYKESFLIAGGLFFVGIMLEFFSIPVPNAPVFPYSFLFIILFALSCVVCFWLNNSNFIVRWFTSIPAAISAIVFFLGLSLLMALITQSNSIEIHWYKRIIASWPYLFSLFYFLLTLGVTAVKRIKNFNVSNISFILNHFGLWLTVAAGSFGSADITKFTVYLTEGQLTWQGYNQYQQVVELPIAFKLIDFTIDDYEPKIDIVDSNGVSQLGKRDKSFYITPNAVGIVNDWKLKVKRYYADAIWMDSLGWKSVYYPGSAPAAEVLISNGNDSVHGWISCGSKLVVPSYLNLLDGTFLIMQTPHPRSYKSDLLIINKEKNISRELLKVNSPIKNSGYSIYQTGYDEEDGKWSTTSIIELVKDPWINVIYVSMFMMILGTVLLIWQGKQKIE